MPEKKKKPFNPPPLMTPKQIATIKEEIAEIKSMLDADDENKRSDVGNFRHSLSHLNVEEVKEAKYAEKQIEMYTPKKITGENANKAFSNLKKLEAWIETNIPKETFVLYPRSKDPDGKAADFERAVQAQVEFIKRGGNKVIESANYFRRRLDPDAPPKNYFKHVRERV